MKDDRMITGREVLRMIAKYFKVNQSAEAVYNLLDLQAISMKGNDLEAFLNLWTRIVTGMRRRPCDEDLEVMFYKNIKAHPLLAEDVAHYNRLDEDAGGDRSYSYLVACVQRAIRRTRQESAHDALHKFASSAASAAPATNKGKGKGKDKDKGKSGG